MKKLLKNEICGSCEQCTGPTDVLKNQILRLLFMNSSYNSVIALKKRGKKKWKMRIRDAETCIQTDT